MGFLSLMATLGLNASGFETKLKQVESMTTKWSRGFQNQLAGAFTVGALTYAAKSVIDYAHEIEEMSRRLGVGTTKLQEWEYAASQTGATIDTVATAIRQLTKNRDIALGDPTGKVAEAFSRLGVSAQMLKTMRIEQIFETIAAKAKELKDPDIFGAAAMAVMGRNASLLYNMMTEGMDTFAKSAHDLGIIIEEENVKALANLVAQIKTLKAELRGLIGENLPTLMKWLGKVWQVTEVGATHLGTYLGARAGGSTDKEAREMADKTSAKVLQKSMIAEQQQRIADAIASRSKGKGEDYSSLKSKADKAARETYATAANVDALQKIGGFAGNVNAEIRVLQQRIADATERTATNTADIAQTVSEDLDL